MSKRIKSRLEDHNIYVFLTNPNSNKVSDIGLTKRANLANEKWKSQGKPSKALFVSIHANYYNAQSNGCETYVATNASSTSKKAANTVNTEMHKEVCKVYSSFRNRGVKVENFTVIKKAYMPSILVESAFYSNMKDLDLLRNHKDAFTEGIVRGMCKHFGITYKPKTSAPSKPVVESKPATPAKPTENKTEVNKVDKPNNNDGFFVIVYEGDADKTIAEVLAWELGESKTVLVEADKYKHGNELKSYAIGKCCDKVECDVEIQGKNRNETLDLVRAFAKNVG